jgi:hypothetical chaperone protein
MNSAAAPFPAIRLERVGIDFGTSNSAASVLGERNGKPVHEIVDLDAGPLLKTLLYFPNAKESYFGRKAIETYFEYEREGRFFQSIKRLLPNPDFSGTQIAGRFVSIEALISRFLAEVKARLEARLGQSLTDASVVFGRPARYSLDDKREALATGRFQEAIRLANFRNFSLLEEPTAASRVAVGRGDSQARPTHSTKGARITLVADLGGGTSDFTLLRSSAGAKTHEVLGVHGIPLAGDALDSTFVSEKLLRFFGSEVTYTRPFSSNVLTFPKSLITRIPKWHQHVILKEKSNWEFLLQLKKEINLPSDRIYLENLLTLVDENLGYLMHQEVEKLKIAASSTPSHAPDPLRFTFRSHPIDIDFPVMRSDYEAVIAPVVARIGEAALDSLKQAGIAPDEVDVLHFTGGTSQVPALRRAITACVPAARVEDQDSFTAVALGLSLQA